MNKKGIAHRDKKVFECKTCEFVTLNPETEEMICLSCGKLKHRSKIKNIESMLDEIKERDSIIRKGKEVPPRCYNKRKELGLLAARR